MERVSLLKVGGASAILYSILIVVIVALFAATDLLEAETASEVLPAMEEDQVIVSLAGWLIVLAAVVLAIAGMALYEALQHAGSLMRLALLAFVGGALLALIRNVLWLALVYELAPAYADATGEARSTLEAVGDTWLMFGFLVGDVMGGVLAGGVGVLLFSLGILRSRVAAPWVGWLGVAAAILGGWFTLLGPVSEVFELINFVGLVAFIAWMVTIGVVLWRASEPAGA